MKFYTCKKGKIQYIGRNKFIVLSRKNIYLLRSVLVYELKGGINMLDKFDIILVQNLF